MYKTRKSILTYLKILINFNNFDKDGFTNFVNLMRVSKSIFNGAFRIWLKQGKNG